MLRELTRDHSLDRRHDGLASFVVAMFCKMLDDDRRRAGWSVGQVAWRLGVSVPEYREIEAGARSPSFETWDRIWKAYGWPQTFVRATVENRTVNVEGRIYRAGDVFDHERDETAHQSLSPGSVVEVKTRKLSGTKTREADSSARLAESALLLTAARVGV